MKYFLLGAFSSAFFLFGSALLYGYSGSMDLGVIAKAIQIGKPANQEIKKFKHVWRRDGSPCKDVSQLVRTIEKLLEDFLKDL